jgi:predicted metal-binding membrane protein
MFAALIFLSNVLMWTAMMAVMMLPAVGPWLLAMRRTSTDSPLLLPGLFLSGYLLVWTGFSVCAATVQAALFYTGLASPMGVPTHPVVPGVFLIMAGIFQMTPLKDRCLIHCQSPIGFFLTSWRDGWSGAVKMGVRHGAHCVGCCWALMTLAFVAGVMNIFWMLGATLFVLIDHALLRTATLTKLSGILFLIAGIWFLSQPTEVPNLLPLKNQHAPIVTFAFAVSNNH